MSPQQQAIELLKTIMDPEINLDIYTLGLIYSVQFDDGVLAILMTFTTPFCPFADSILEQIELLLGTIHGVESVAIELTFEPAWSQDMINESARLEKGML
jgi:metal-sulfur cluster biosynthetic enzyme